MKFIKGMVTGVVLTCGACVAYCECTMGTNKMLKKGKKMMKKLGIV